VTVTVCEIVVATKAQTYELLYGGRYLTFYQHQLPHYRVYLFTLIFVGSCFICCADSYIQLLEVLFISCHFLLGIL